MRSIFIAILMFFCSMTSAVAGVSVSIGLNVPVYPQLVPVPGYPVYYAPGLNSNYFFYDGMYWVFVDDNWYASTWYNGPWGLVAPDYVPLFILRVPVSYYRYPPVYFRAWYANAPPRWGEHWGSTWEEHHRGWNTWNRAAVPAPAPLPVYQRQYSGTRYPAVEQQYALQTQNYRYQPRDAVVRQHYQASSQAQSAPVRQSSTAPAPSQPSQAQRREAQRSTITPSHQAAVPPSRGEPAQVERSQIHRAPVTPAPAQQAAAPPPRAQPSQVERSQRPANVPPQAAAPSPRGQAPQRNERLEAQRAASAPTPPQRQAKPPQEEQHAQQKNPQGNSPPPSRGQKQEEQHAQQKSPQGNGPPPSRGQNQEREGGRG